jgi:hypothetical protein
MNNLQVTTQVKNDDAYHIYYDIDIINNDQKNGEPTPWLKFNDSRSMPFISKPDNYFCSIVRFSLQTPSLPIFIPQVKIGQTDVNKLIYEITVVNSNGDEFTRNVQFIQYDTIYPTPQVPLDFQDLSSRYYYVYSMQHWVKMVNNTMFNACISAGVNTPILYFDVNTSLFKFYIPHTWTSEKLLFNNQLQTLFDSFQFKKTELFRSELDYYNNYFLNTKTINNIDYYEMLQESTTLPLYNPVRSIVFTTGLFPIKAELTTNPKVFGSDASLFNTGNNAGITPIITDFEINVANLNTYKESISYTPTAEYRLVDLFGSSPVNALELSVWWKDHFGNLHPFVLNSGCSCGIKFMFRRKDFNIRNL